MKDSNKIKELSLKVAILFDLDIFAVEPNFIVRSIASGFYDLVVSLFLKLLSIVEVFPIHNH